MSKKKRASFSDDELPNEVSLNRPPIEDEEPFPTSSPFTNQEQSDPIKLSSQMMTTFQNMMNVGVSPQQWASSTPFQVQEIQEPDAVDHDIILPKTIHRGITVQESIKIHPFFGKLFLKNDSSSMNGLPMGCTITLTGPAYSGKTRSALEMVINAVSQDIRTAYVVAEEGFYDSNSSGRNDLFSRFLSLGINLTGLSEDEFRAQYDDRYYILPNQYHLGKTWAEFIRDYRYLVEDLGCKLTIIDSINMLDPSKLNTVDNLNALKTYNHEQGITCIVIGQVKDSGIPQGGEALFHSSEVAIHIYEKNMTSKAEADIWGSEYRNSIMLVSARSKVCNTISVPIRIDHIQDGLIRASEFQAERERLSPNFWEG